MAGSHPGRSARKRHSPVTAVATSSLPEQQRARQGPTEADASGAKPRSLEGAASQSLILEVQAPSPTVSRTMAL